ncbi:ribosome biogenesis GTPase Der [Metamycoplasma hominis]|uniref:GTPase Der n=2 Tax=Metamycoplasma hominis TaxID=2098 RepID=D1J7V5_METH1|nr:ribosome biogenesis GTPase Der [Metamycoplasma hominis]AUW37014.1 ribosome biogenesis GTPase Der [Metamycoplasma hominis]AYN65293.1 ribosome biogenesis GTPase Der [Metamycoplasma hominis]KGF61693.1 GTP-binding protein Der [Metamycoplasma hominis]MBD3898730.1 ribosome biogenesis GTPase Der [Metamycoplasma hominis]MCF1354785.1 ribosome biogenesis GTPase Der [Metamycoplasma hominis]
MMRNNIVAIIGKPNVGKSTLFNKIINKRKSIVYDTPGVTRDRLYEDAIWTGKKFRVVDTGGITIEDEDFKKQIKLQAQIAIDEANVIVFLIDGKEPLTVEDYYVASLLRKSNKHVLLAVNKLEGSNVNYYDNSIYSLGFDEIFPISAIHGDGIGNLLDKIIEKLNFSDKDVESYFKLALLGKTNVGKSTLLNTLANEERSIVSNVEGTTRDSVSSLIKINGEIFEVVDTAGIKRKSKLTESVEHYALMRANQSIEDANLCLLVLDATEEVSHFSQNVIGIAYELKKPLILIVNKWDLIEKDTNTMEKYKKDLLKKVKFVDWSPIVFISAKDNLRINKLRDTIIQVKNNISRKINTNQLNDLMATAQMIRPASSINGRRLSITFARQIDGSIPTFLLFVNNVDLAHFTYLRYIENQIRENYDFSGTPIELVLRNKNKKEERE